MTLIDELLYEIEGRSAVAGDAATVRLEAVLAKIRHCGPRVRDRLLDQLVRMREEAELDVRTAKSRREKAVERVASWEINVAKAALAEPTGTLRDQAQERVETARGDVVSIDEEIAEYETTVERLAEIRALIASVGE